MESIRRTQLSLSKLPKLLILFWILATSPASATGPDEIFNDGFESGDTSAWDLTSPPITTAFNYCQDFETGAFEPEWIPLPSDPDGLVEVGSIISGIDLSHGGTYGAAIGKSASSDFETNALELHLDLSSAAQLDLSFWLHDTGDSTHAADGLYLSDDGGVTFQKALDFDPSNWVDAWGSLPPFDLDRAAANLGLEFTDSFVLRFQQYGYQSLGSDGFVLDDVKVMEPHTQPATLPFSDGFESGALGSAWHWGDPRSTTFANTMRPGGLVEVGSNLQGIELAHGGFYGAALGRRNTGDWTTNALDLHLDLNGASEVQLSFWSKDLNDETHTVDGLYFSNDGGTSFTKVFDFAPSDWSSFSYGRLPPLPVDRLASDHGLTLNDQFVIRFQQYGYANLGSDGLVIDDIAVESKPTTYAALPFADGFETASLGPAWAWANPLYPASTSLDDTVLPGGLVEVASSIQGYEIAHFGNYGVALGRRVTGNWTTNALDLHLNLQGQSQVELRFWLKDRQDESHNQDAIYFSSNGGENFRQVYLLTPGSRPNDTYEEVVLDVDSLAAGLGISLTDQFVIRFQQYGYADFNGDGLMIDDVSVSVP